MGGLGNQLFQIFATISYAIKTRNKFVFHNVKTLGGGSTTLRFTYWNTFLKRLQPFLINEIGPIHVIRENSFEYNELPLYEMIGRDVLLYGYFQSYKYFQNNYPTISRIIGLGQIKDELLKKMNYDDNFLKDVISLHFRIGDYKKIQDYHPIMTKEYYHKSLEFINTKCSNTNFTVMYFCEDNDIIQVNETINDLSSKFTNFTFIRGENKLEDWEQMVLMSCCHHNIIANSSFSWWGAYFNVWSDKIVCYPSVWFGEKASHNTSDLCPDNWNKINVY